MPRLHQVTVSSQAASAWIPLDRFSPHKSISVRVAAESNLTYSVEFTNDDVQDAAFVAADASVQTITDLATKTANAIYSGILPARAVRLNVSAFSAGSATLQINQG